MKKLLLGALALTFFLGSCSDDDSPRSIRKSSEIIINGAVASSSLRAAFNGPIDATFSLDFPIGIYSKKGAWTAGSTNWINNDNATVAGAGGHAITFASGPYYYPTDGATLDFYAFAPQGVESTAAAVATSPEVTITLDGHQDIMWASSTGSKVGSAAPTPPVLNFTHNLVQLQFTFKSGTGYPASGNKVTSLVIKAQPTTAVMTVETGVCVFSGSADMQALSAANQLAGIGITSAGANALSPVMTKPVAGSTGTFIADITVQPAGGGSPVTYAGVSIDVASSAGEARMITLTFNATAITASASVAAWVSATGGTGTAQ